MFHPLLHPYASLRSEIRKRQRIQKFGHILKIMAYPLSFVGPLMTLPQIFEIVSSQDASGLSLITWIAWLFMASFWYFYGWVHEDRAIMFSNLLWILVEIGVIVGILLYS